jgi:acyl transferase domain-containing protein
MRSALLAWLGRHVDDHALEEVAFTLNAGRDHFEYRLAWVAGTISELQRQVAGTAVHAVEPVRAVDGEGLERLLDRATPDYMSALQRVRRDYVAGQTIDWMVLHRNESQRRLNMPGYSFDTSSFWIEGSEAGDRDRELARGVGA